MNRYTSTPYKAIYWTEQNWDEMFNGFFEYVIKKFDRKPLNDVRPVGVEAKG